MTKVHIPTPAERQTLLNHRRQETDRQTSAVDQLLERCRSVLVGPEPTDGKLTVSLFCESEAVVADVISILAQHQWRAEEVDNGKSEGFTNLVLTPMPFSI